MIIFFVSEKQNNHVQVIEHAWNKYCFKPHKVTTLIGTVGEFLQYSTNSSIKRKLRWCHLIKGLTRGLIHGTYMQEIKQSLKV